MRAEAARTVGEGRDVRSYQISRERVHIDDFVTALRQWKCDIYHPVLELADAFQAYGHIEIYADPLAARLLDDSSIVRSFINNQRRGLDLETNLKETFANFRFRALIHQDGPIALFASPMNLGKLTALNIPQPRSEDLREVIGMETDRAFTPGLRTDTLDAIEENPESNPDLIADLMLEGVEFGRDGKIGKKDK